MTPRLSDNDEREKAYQRFLASSHKTFRAIVQLGNTLMRKEKLYRHTFFNATFWERLYGSTYMLPTVRYLACFALRLPPPSDPHMYDAKTLSEEEAIAVLRIFEKRIEERCPVEYITQECVYSGHTFYVNENVLVPRSVMDTQFQAFLDGVRWNNYRVLDLCTGSGCIGITLALLDPRLKVDLADISSKALEVARVNVVRYHLESRVRCVQSDLFEKLEGQYDLIISNPPYVTRAYLDHAPPELKSEPQLALDGGQDGLILVERIVDTAGKYLNENGQLIMEVGFEAPKLLKKRYPGRFTWRRAKPSPEDASWLDFIVYSGDCILQATYTELGE